jgi:uncharacterized protein
MNPSDFSVWARMPGDTRSPISSKSFVDILVVYSGPPRGDAYKIVRRALDVRGLEPHVYSEEEAESLRLTLDRLTRQGIDLVAST